MADQIESSSWTGPPEAISAPARATPTHRSGAPSTTGDFARIAEAQRLAGMIPPELRPIVKLALILVVAQSALWIATGILDSAIGDPRVAGHGGTMILWAAAAALVGVWQLKSRSVRWVRARQTLLKLAILVTFVLAIGNVYLGLRSQAAAIASKPERVFMWSSSNGRWPFQTTTHHDQRADGALLDGSVEEPLPYGRTCALVQHRVGPNGYAWVRTLDRSRAPGRGELAWPIRRAECFSEIPLSTLPR